MDKRRIMIEIVNNINILCPGFAEAIVAGIFDPLNAKNPQEAKDFIENNIKILTSRLESMKRSFNIDEAQAFEYMRNMANFSADEWIAVEKFSFDASRLGNMIANSLFEENLEIRECTEKLRQKKSSLTKKARRRKWLQA